MDSLTWGGVWEREREKKSQMWVTEARDIPEGFGVGYNGCCLLCETKNSWANYSFSGKPQRSEGQLHNHIIAEWFILNTNISVSV